MGRPSKLDLDEILERATDLLWERGCDAVTTRDLEAALVKLLGFFEGISDESVTEINQLMPEVLPNETAYEETYAGGDAEAGAEKYAAFCGSCHDSGWVMGSVASFSAQTVTAFSPRPDRPESAGLGSPAGCGG